MSTEAPYFVGARFLCEAPPGAQLITVDDKVILVAPGHPACYVTPTGLVPIPVHEAPAG